MEAEDEILKAAAEDYGDCPADFSAIRIRNLRAESERLKTELADTKRVYGNADSTNEQKWVMLEEALKTSEMGRDMAVAASEELQKERDALEGAIREAIWMQENCGASEFNSPEYGPVYTVDPASFDEIAEILRKAVQE